MSRIWRRRRGFDQDETHVSPRIPASRVSRGAARISISPAADQVGGRGRETAIRSRNTQIVVEVPPRISAATTFGDSRTPEVGCGGRRQAIGAVPRQDVEELCHGRHQEAGRGAVARRQRRAGSANAWTDDDIQTSLSPQSGVRERRERDGWHFHHCCSS